MASTTSNLGLTKPAGTDKALVSVINSNSEILDGTAGGLMDALAIVAQGNTHGAISAGQYVYVRGHDTLAEGLYVASTAIAANATLTSSNLTADSDGGLNSLNSNMASLSEHLDLIGTLVNGPNNSTSVIVPNATVTEINSITLNTAGTYIIIGSADWGTNATGYRQISFGSGVNPGRYYTSTTTGVSSKETYQQVLFCAAITSQTTYTLYGIQTSGGNLNVYPHIVAIRIK